VRARSRVWPLGAGPGHIKMLLDRVEDGGPRRSANCAIIPSLVVADATIVVVLLGGPATVAKGELV
jgi:hypothetical protein